MRYRPYIDEWGILAFDNIEVSKTTFYELTFLKHFAPLSMPC